MRKNNEVESPNPWLYGRYLPEYRDKGYLSTNVRLNCVVVFIKRWKGLLLPP